MRLEVNFSVVVPVFYKEEMDDVVAGIKEIYKVLNEGKSNYIGRWELIVVIDGYSSILFKALSEISPKIKVYQYEKNQGKGYALVYGFRKSSGRFITFIDCDGDISLKQIFNFFPYLATADIVIGSKRHPFSKIQYPLTRRILSRGFQVISFLILGSSLRDTQSGLKIIKREVFDVIEKSIQISHFTFDLEVCFLAQRHGFRVVEAPIQINFKHSSTIKISSIFKMFYDIFRIRFWFSFSKSYQKKFKDTYFR